MFQSSVRKANKEGIASHVGSKIPPAVDADGRKIEVDVREDEEQEVKLQEIIELLVAAGYFRARIKGLAPFDKIVGGMTWCLELCNCDVDVDLLFQESLTIGQKISLTEKIVTVLKQMKCPHRLEPHQIQGLDCINIYPVVQWLVKRTIEVREETGDFIRSYAEFQFHKGHSLPTDVPEEEITQQSENVKHIKESYRPQRRYRRHTKENIPDRETQVQCTLLEYGHKSHWISLPHGDQVGNDINVKQSQQDTQNDHKVEKLRALMETMTTAEVQDSRLSAATVGSIVGLRASEISQAADEYAEKEAERNRQGEIFLGSPAQLSASLEKQVTLLQEKITVLLEHKKELENKATTMQDELVSLQVRAATADQGIKEMEEEHMQRGDAEVLRKLQALVELNENLKQQEAQFRDQCKKELVTLQNIIESVDGPDEMELNAAEVAQQHSIHQEQLQKLRLVLAKRNRAIATLQRQIDEVPTRAELSQYQRRFIELYNQVAAKHKETKQYFTLYNTLDDIRAYLQKELSLLNSVLDNFPDAMANNANREQFLKQFESIVEGVHQNKLKVEKKRQDERARRDRLSDVHLSLLDQQRTYFRTVKELTEECRMNEALLGRLQQT